MLQMKFKHPLLSLALFLTALPLMADVPVWDGALTKTDRSVSASWTTGNNPAGTRYLLEMSPQADFASGTVISSQTVLSHAKIDELQGNHHYFVRVQTLDPTPSAYADPVKEITTLASPALAPVLGDTFAPDPTGITVRWSSNENADSTIYHVKAFTDATLTKSAGSGDTTATSLRITPLASNTPYWFTVTAANILYPGNAAAFNAGSAITLPGDYTLTSNPLSSETVSYGLDNSNVTFKTDGFSSGKVGYFRYRWMQNDVYSWPADDLQNQVPNVWTSSQGDLVIPNAVSGQYYLHIKAYNNSAAKSNGAASEKVMGPFLIDATPPSPDPSSIENMIPAVNAITWRAAIAVDSDSGLNAKPYAWTFNGGAETFNINQTSVTTNLSANTAYSMTVRTRDAAQSPNFSASATQNSVTLQNQPTSVQILNVTANSMQVQVNGTFPNLTVGQSGLEVSATDGNVAFSNVLQTNVITLLNINANTVYDVTARAINQAGVKTNWTAPVQAITPGGSSSVTATPAPGKYPGGTRIRFTDNGAFDQGVVAYYKMVISDKGTQPGTVAFDQSARLEAGSWSRLFSTSQAPFAHIQSYDHFDQPIAGGYTRLGPWIIDADAPQDMGGSTMTVTSVSQMTAIAGDVTDIGLAGLDAAPYSFDNGTTFQPGNSFSLSGLEANSLHGADIVYKDQVGNKSLPIHVEEHTFQNAPTGIHLDSKNGKQVVVSALGTFPHMDDNLSGIQFGLVNADSTIDWQPIWLKDIQTTFNFTSYNATYKVVARARNADGILTAVSAPLTVNTQPTAPAVSPVSTAVEESTTSATFKFKALDLPGANTYDHYLYVWTKNATYAFDGSLAETSWKPASLSEILTVTAADSGQWYLHMRSVNTAGEQSNTVTLGWFGRDILPPTGASLLAPVPDVNSITWQTTAITDNMVGLADEPYLWSLDGGTERPTTAANPVFISLDLAPNSRHTISLRVKDKLGNTTLPLTLSAYTLAALPVSVAGSAGYDVQKTSAIVPMRDGGNPNGTVFKIEISADKNFVSLNEPTISLTRNNPADGVMSVSFGTSGTPLSPNTTYYVRARTLNHDNVLSLPVVLSTFTTRPVSPSVTINPSGPIQSLGTAYTVTNQISYGPGSIEFLRYVWHTSPAPYNWSNLDNRANADHPTISFTADNSGTFYLHVAAFSGGFTPNFKPEEQVLGPYRILDPNATQAQIVAINKTDTTITVSQAPLPNVIKYGFQLDSGDIFYQDDPNYTFSKLTANTKYRVQIYVKNGAGDLTGPIAQDVTTKQTLPTGIQISNINTTTAQLDAQGNFANVGQLQTGFHFTLQAGLSTINSPWLPNPTWTVPAGQLLPNTPYTVTAQSRNSLAEATLDSIPVSFTTLAKIPTATNNQVVSDNNDFTPQGYYKLGKVFVFANKEGYGPGNLQYYRVIVTNDSNVPALADFDDATKSYDWTPTIKYSTQPANAGTYYMHFRSYNVSNVGGPVYTFGPLFIDNQPPMPNPPKLENVELFTDHVVWSAVPAADVGGAGLPNAPYHFQYGTTDLSQDIWRGCDPLLPHPCSYTSPLNLQPNTTHSIVLAVRDNLGNTTQILKASTYTLAAMPFPMPSSLQVFITSAAFAWDKLNNSPVTRYEVGAFLSGDVANSAPAFVKEVDVNSSTGSIANLNLDTVYWFAVRAVNFYGIRTAWALIGNGRTKNEIVAPIITLPLTAATDHVIMNWVDLNPLGTSYEVLSNAGVPLLIGGTPVPVGTGVSSRQFDGLTPNTTYSFGVRAKSSTNIYSSYASAVAVTLAMPPLSAAPMVVHRTSATVSWTANGNPAGTVYEVHASTAATLDGANDSTMTVTGLSGQITGLIPDTLYYVSVRAINYAGVPTVWLSLGSGITGVQPPQPPYLFLSTTTTSFRLTWASGGNPAGVQYAIERSLDNFGGGAVTLVTTPNLLLDAANLTYNTTYFFRGKAIGTHGESPVVPMGSIVTYATNPVNGLLASALDSMHISWGSNGNPDGTAYYVEMAADPVFQQVQRSDNVVGNETTVNGLHQNTTYWVRIFAVNHDGIRSDYPAKAGYAVTLASTPVIPLPTAKWSAALGNYVMINISAGDLNPIDTEYAIFSLKDNAYLTGDAAGSTSPTPVWWTRDDWNTTSLHAGKGIHGHLLPLTAYQYKVRARSHAQVLTDFSDVYPVTTVPDKPKLTVSVVDSDYALLSWGQQGANAFRTYVSPTGTPGSFQPYHDFVGPDFVHYIKLEGSDDIPSSLTATRHDTDGGRPGQMTALQFVDADTDTLHFSWTTVPDPSPAPIFFYYLTGLSGFGEEGAPSDVLSAQVKPIIKNYVIAGVKVSSITDNAYQYLAAPAGDTTIPALGSNAHLNVQIKARSSDGVDGNPSPFIDAWTLAHVPNKPTVTTGFDDSHHLYNNVIISTAGNPAHTEYAIRWIEGDRFLTGQGGAIAKTIAGAGWFSKERWDEGFTHTGLPSAQTFTYEVYARNGDHLGGPHIVTAASVSESTVTLSFQPPTGLSGRGESQTAIRWSWMDNSTDENKFEVLEKKADGTLVLKVERGPSIPQSATGPLDVLEAGIATPNTAVVRVVRGANNDGYSLPSGATTAYTLAADPDVSSINHKINITSNEIKFLFSNNAVFGPGTMDYYRVKFTTSPVYVFTHTEERWDNPSQTKEFTRDVIAENTNWYLHVMSYNHDNTPSPLAKIYGPYPLFQDVVAPQVEELRQDGASSISGARDLSSLAGLLTTKNAKFHVKAELGKPQLDASFASGVPWAPSVQGVHIIFSKRLDGATITNKSVVVNAIEDNMSQSITPKQMDYVLDYNDPQQELSILFEQPGLPAGYLFEVRLTAGVKDVAGNSLASEFIYYFRTFMDPSVTNEMVTLDPSGKLNMRVHLPAGSLPDTGSIGIETDPNDFPWGFDNGSRQRANQKQLQIGGLFATPLAERFVSNFDSHHARTNGKLRGGALVSIPYTDDNNDGYVDSMPVMAAKGAGNSGVKVKVANLSLYRFDEGSQLWVKVPGSTIDTQNKMVVAVTYDMGVFAVIGTASTDVGSTYAYPVPFVWSKDNFVNFVNLPDSGEIKIYTVAGELVKEIQFGPGHQDPLPWDVKGENIGADVYLYHITSGGNKKTGKLVIVK